MFTLILGSGGVGVKINETNGSFDPNSLYNDGFKN